MNNRELAFKKFKTFPPPCGEYGLLFPRKNYKPNEEIHKLCVDKSKIDESYIKKLEQRYPLLTAEYLIKSGTAFKLYKWMIDGRETPINKYANQVYIDYRTAHEGCLIGAYIPWIHYTAKRRFELIKDFSIKESQAMPAMHMWFKNTEDLENWFGSYYNKLVVDAIVGDKKTKK